MDLAFSKDDLAFRDEVRRFIDENFDANCAPRSRSRRTAISTRRISSNGRARFIAGWAAPNWPVEFGGPGWTPSQKFIFESETAAAGTPDRQPHGPQDGGARADGVRQRCAEEEISASDPRVGRVVVPGLFGTWIGLRPRFAADALRGQGRPLSAQRLEDLDDPCPMGGLDVQSRAHETRRQAAGRHQLHSGRYAHAGNSGRGDRYHRLSRIRPAGDQSGILR